MKRILVALDGSSRAPQVLAAALRLADMSGAKLVLYRAVGASPDLPRELLPDGSGLEDVLIRHARAELERIAETAPPAILEGILTGFATPWDGICTIAKERDVDLIVIGSHGFGVIDRLLGTVAAKVVNHADRNVLVVRTAL
ncbi:MAG: universal stress protein [Deltaproteobacteria bacterium]